MGTVLKVVALFIISSVYFIISGCTGTISFPTSARAGDTISLATGWKHNFSPEVITVTFTPPTGAPIEYAPGDPAVRGVINMYPDPVSRMVVMSQVGNGVPEYDAIGNYGGGINTSITDGDNDWWETSVFLDLPATLPVGTTQITINSTSGESYGPYPVEIVAGTGSPTSFDYFLNGNTFSMISTQFDALERSSHFVVNFSGTTIPHSIQITLSHDPALSVGGTGIPYVVNTRGDIKNINWSDDGNNLLVMLMPAKGQTFTTFKDFKFYVSGGISGLTTVDVQAFDIDGNQLTGTTASIQ